MGSGVDLATTRCYQPFVSRPIDSYGAQQPAAPVVVLRLVARLKQRRYLSEHQGQSELPSRRCCLRRGGGSWRWLSFCWLRICCETGKHRSSACMHSESLGPASRRRRLSRAEFTRANACCAAPCRKGNLVRSTSVAERSNGTYPEVVPDRRHRLILPDTGRV